MPESPARLELKAWLFSSLHRSADLGFWVERPYEMLTPRHNNGFVTVDVLSKG